MIDAMGFVTAGGLSSRMGMDKAWLELGGQSMIGRVIGALKPVTSRVALIANNPKYSRLGLPIFSDRQTGIGPLEAIRTALENADTSRVILVGCDLPFVTTELFKFLLDLPGDYQAVVPIGDDGKLEPLCSIYCKEALSVVSEIIRVGQRKVSPLFDQIPTRFVAFDELKHLEDSELFFRNINTPQDYEEAAEATRSSSQTSGCDGQTSS